MEEFGEGARSCPHCGHPVVAAPSEGSALPEGSILSGRYILGRVLGTGGFGITYLGYDGALGRKVAIKEYFPSDFAKRAHESARLSVFSGDAAGYFRRGLASFLDEARRLAAFAREGNIVAVHDTLEANNTAYIVMEYLEGQTLRDLLKEKDKLNFSEAMSIITPVLDALSAVHGAGIIHRDVAPDNIFIRADGSVTLIDFGAARAFAQDANRSMTVVLKPGYAPTEQYLSKGSQGPWTDVYATAATLYRILTGTVPEESMQRALRDSLVPPSDLVADLPPKAERALLAALVVKPELRTQDIAALKAGLVGSPKVARQPAPAAEPATVASATAPPPPAAAPAAMPTPTPADGEKSNAPAVALTVIVVAIIAVVVLFIALLQPSGSSALPSIESVGQRVEFGTWNGEPITWRVLAIEDGRALVISEYVLEQRPYNDGEEKNAEITWEESTLRQYLNGEFLQASFSVDEQSYIVTVTNENPDNPASGTDGGNATKDRAFLLSIEEAEKYFTGNSDRVADDLQGQALWWLLRSPGTAGVYAARVNSDGAVDIGGYGVRVVDGVRPALWLNLAADDQAALSTPPTGSNTMAANDQAEPPSTERVGERVEFGTWRDEPITWRVLAVEDGRALVISEDILTVLRYDDLDADTSYEIGGDLASAIWAESDIRAWLNDEFLNTAFTKEEQRAIDLALISNPDNPEYGSGGGVDTEDKVFLLSIDEANRYFSDNSDRIANITMTEEDIQYRLRDANYWGYNKRQLADYESTLRSDYLGQSKARWWWLRSCSGLVFGATIVDEDGRVSADGISIAIGVNFYGDDTGGGVRPALWLNL
jgi:serine/threonine protein kinase